MRERIEPWDMDLATTNWSEALEADGDEGEPEEDLSEAAPSFRSSKATVTPGQMFIATLLMAVLVILTGICCLTIATLGRSPVDSGLAVLLVAVPVLFLLIVAAVLSLALRRPGAVLVPMGIIMTLAIGGTWGYTAISNATKSYVSPEIVGVIEAAQVQSDGSTQVRLSDGRGLNLAQESSSVDPLDRPGGRYYPLLARNAGMGDFLLAGGGSDPWYLIAFPHSNAPSQCGKACYLIPECSGWLSADRVRLAIGVDLVNHLDPSFRPGSFRADVWVDGSGAAVELWTLGGV